MSTITGTLSNEKGIAAFLKKIPISLAALALVWLTRSNLGYKPEFFAKKVRK